MTASRLAMPARAASPPARAASPPASTGRLSPPAPPPARSGAVAHDISRIEGTLADLLRLTGSIRVHEARVRAAGLRLSRTQLSFLGWLAERGPTPVSKLAEWADVSQPAASRALSHLEAAGFVRRHADDTDGRVNLMVLTDEGMRARARILDLMRSQLASALSDMSAADRKRLADLLTRLVAGLRAARVTGPEPS
ncbi:MAG: MarR family winged helix-turn-helix transcriptional regulator [Acidimicrobiales bacterium]